MAWTDFYPRSPRGERPFHDHDIITINLFLSTLPARGATWLPLRLHQVSNNFYPRSPRGERRSPTRWTGSGRANFYPRSPRGERRPPVENFSIFPNFYPRSPRGERRYGIRKLGLPDLISIHAPREGSDTFHDHDIITINLFLSTLPARGATAGGPCRAGKSANFYPRSPRGERLERLKKTSVSLLISIHAPREGSDSQKGGSPVPKGGFLSTLPARGATHVDVRANKSR